MSYGPHHQPLKSIDRGGTIAVILVFTITTTASVLGGFNLPTLPRLAWTLIFAVLPWIQSRSIREYDPLCRPYLKSVWFIAKLTTSFVTPIILNPLFDGGEQSSDPVLRTSCWVLIAIFPLLKTLILGCGMVVADVLLDGRTLPWIRK